MIAADHAPFFQAIIDRPEDDLPRLVFADYLEDQGQAERAEFIRVQCELARTADSETAKTLRHREAELLADHRREWTLPRLEGQQVFRRGFLHSVGATAEQLLRFGAELFGSHPVQQLRIIGADLFVERLATELPGLSRITALDLSNNSFGGRNRLAQFLGLAKLDRLHSLTLRNNQLWADDMEVLGQSRLARQLQLLDVSGNPIGGGGIEAIARLPNFAGLRALYARCDEIPFTESIHAAGAVEIAESHSLQNLQVLVLDGHYIGDAGLIGLARSRTLRHLQELSLADNEIGLTGESGIEALVASRNFQQLQVLNLSRNAISRLSAQALAHWPELEHLRAVRLDDCELTSTARAAIDQSPWASRFQFSPEEGL